MRVEQLAPFPYDLVTKEADKYPNADVFWCQEEPLNQGAWNYVDLRIETALSKTESHAGKRPRYTGRTAAASTATGNKYAHIAELQVRLPRATPRALPPRCAAAPILRMGRARRRL
jgi:2-oxoglutarate dehydrogenase E1 component